MGQQSQPYHRPKRPSAKRASTPAASSHPQAKSAGPGAYAGLGIVLLIFLLLATLHSLLVPITQGEDELAHYRYISFIAQKGRLPIDYAERKQAWYRADWPPFYHLLVGWAVSPLDTTQPHLKDVGESPRRRLAGEIFYPRLIIYTEDATWPWQDGILAWYLGRFISIIFSAGALVFTYLSVLEMSRGGDEAAARRGEVQKFEAIASSPHKPSHPALLLALATTALLAFTPRYLFTSAMLGDDSLFVLLSALFIWLLLWAIRGDDRWWLYAAMGLLLGLSIVTKYSTGLLPLVIIPVVMWQVRRAGWSWSRALGRVALTWVFTLVGASWWFAWIGYYFNTIKEDGLIFGLLKPLLASGPDVSMRRIFAIFGGGEFTGQERPDAIAAGTFGDWLIYLFQTFWGVPVLEHDPLFPWAYLLLFLFCLLALIGLWKLWPTASGEMRLILGVLSLIVILLFPFPVLRFFLTRNILETGQGRHILYPAAQAIPILLVLGWAALLRKIEDRRSKIVGRRLKIEDSQQDITSASFTIHYPLSTILHPPSSILIFLPSLLLLLWSLFQLGYMAVTYPAPLPVRTTTFDVASIPQPLKHNFGAAIQLLGYDFVPDAEQAIVNLTLFWKALEPVDENYRIQVQLVDEAGRPHFTWLSHPLNGRYPTRAWDKGDIIRDTLPLPLAAVPANRYDLQLSLLHEAEDTPLTAEPFQFIHIPLTTRPPIHNASRLTGDIEYRLWVDDAPARYRQTLPLSWTYADSELTAQSALSGFQSPTPKPVWTLVGPDDVPRLPAATSDATAIFMVGADWPSGAYRLQLSNSKDNYQTEPLLTVANEARQFQLPLLPEGWTPLEANFADQVKLLGYSLPTRRVEPGGGLPLTLYWQSLAPVLGDYVVFDKLLDEHQQLYGGYDRLPREYYSTILWAEGELVEDGFAVPVAPDAPPGVYDLHVGLYTLKSGGPISLPLIQAGQPTDVTSVVIGPIKVGGPPSGVTTENPGPQVKLNQTLGGQITLLG
ncbi:MAG TPA: glycosyltransferase family 39 protein, partial [Anaerolineae bacterium]|nr:glycosyltransferase family 39 protein [Anaerolineae bacterium]